MTIEVYLYLSLAAGTFFSWDFYQDNKKAFEDMFLISVAVMYVLSVIVWPYLMLKYTYDYYQKPKTKSNEEASE